MSSADKSHLHVSPHTEVIVTDPDGEQMELMGSEDLPVNEKDQEQQRSEEKEAAPFSEEREERHEEEDYEEDEDNANGQLGFHN